jgi:hypothetical protein
MIGVKVLQINTECFMHTVNSSMLLPSKLSKGHQELWINI